MTTVQKAPSAVDSINGRVFKIKVINWNSFSIGDTTNFKPYVRNGIVKNIKIPKKITNESFVESLNNFDKMLDQNLGIYDFEKMGDNFSVFACFYALGKFSKSGKSPRPRNWNEEDAKAFGVIVGQICQDNKKSEEETKDILKFAETFSYTC